MIPTKVLMNQECNDYMSDSEEIPTTSYFCGKTKNVLSGDRYVNYNKRNEIESYNQQYGNRPWPPTNYDGIGKKLTEIQAKNLRESNTLIENKFKYYAKTPTISDKQQYGNRPWPPTNYDGIGKKLTEIQAKNLRESNTLIENKFKYYAKTPTISDKATKMSSTVIKMNDNMGLQKKYTRMETEENEMLKEDKDNE
ncbi:unnamed protein product [Gordionus sp. m RMFG-2023]